MEGVRIQLSALWVALMLTYLLGDVLRIFSGDFKPGEIGGMQVSQGMFGARGIDVAPNPHGLPVPDIEPSREPLGKYHRSHIALAVQPRWTAYIPFSL